MAISKDNLVILGRDIRACLAIAFNAGAKAHASTKEVMDYMSTGRMSAVLVGGEKERFAMLRVLAEYGYPGAKRGAPRQSRIFGRMVDVRPWLWHLADESEISAWAAKMSSETRAYVKKADREAAMSVAVKTMAEQAAKLEEQAAKMAMLEEQMRNLLASTAGVVAR